MTYHNRNREVNLKHVLSCLILFVVCSQHGSLAASTRHHRRHKIDPKNEKAILEGLGMKRKPDNDDRYFLNLLILK